MKDQKKDRRSQRTRRLLTNALIALMQKSVTRKSPSKLFSTKPM
jgi:hypothetical protein